MCLDKGNQMRKTTKAYQWHAIGIAAAAILSAYGSAAAAAVSEQEAIRLGKDMTAVGAEKAANRDGSIPEWKGGTPKGKHKLGEPRADLFAGEKPLFTVDAGSVDKYKDKLSAGQIELLKTRKGYRLDVYPTHRSCGYPDSVYEQTRKNATLAKLTADS